MRWLCLAKVVLPPLRGREAGGLLKRHGSLKSKWFQRSDPGGLGGVILDLAAVKPGVILGVILGWSWRVIPHGGQPTGWAQASNRSHLSRNPPTQKSAPPPTPRERSGSGAVTLGSYFSFLVQPRHSGPRPDSMLRGTVNLRPQRPQHSDTRQRTVRRSPRLAAFSVQSRMVLDLCWN